MALLPPQHIKSAATAAAAVGAGDTDASRAPGQFIFFYSTNFFLFFLQLDYAWSITVMMTSSSTSNNGSNISSNRSWRCRCISSPQVHSFFIFYAWSTTAMMTSSNISSNRSWRCRHVLSPQVHSFFFCLTDFFLIFFTTRLHAHKWQWQWQWTATPPPHLNTLKQQQWQQ